MNFQSLGFNYYNCIGEMPLIKWDWLKLWNETENLIYLLNEKGELYSNPFFGTTDFSLGKNNKSGKINLTIGSQEGIIYNYKIN